VSAVNSSHNEKNTAAVGEKLRQEMLSPFVYESWNFNSGNYLFTTGTK